MKESTNQRVDISQQEEFARAMNEVIHSLINRKAAEELKYKIQKHPAYPTDYEMAEAALEYRKAIGE